MTHIDLITAVAVFVGWVLMSIPVGLLVGHVIRLGDPRRECDDFEVDR